MPPTNEPNPAADRYVLAALRRFDRADYSVQAWSDVELLTSHGLIDPCKGFAGCSVWEINPRGREILRAAS